MRFLTRSRRWLVVLAVLAAGCAKLNLEKTVTLEPGEFRAITLDPHSSNQRVTVTAHSDGAPIDVYAVLEADQDAALKSAEQALRTNKSPNNAVDGRPKVTETSFT